MATEENENEGFNIDIELPEEIAEGAYANFAIIAHSSSEFVLDFVRLMPGVPKGKVKSRVVMNPQQAKRLLQALAENVQRFEHQFGDIKDQEPLPVFSHKMGQA
jgi:hypothetical protein